MSAKSDLFERLKYLETCLGLSSLIDNGIGLNDHNGMANLLRKGLGIVAFNILEDYIKSRTEEALNYLPHTNIKFANLTDILQEASTLGTLNALVFRSKLEKKAGGDWKNLIQEEALKIHSTKNANYEISKYSFVSANPNIGTEDVTLILKAFGIQGGWNTLKIVSDKIGGGIADLSQSYKNASERRHLAAHTASFKYDYNWLSGIKNEILAIAASFDILLAARCRQVRLNSLLALDEHQIADALEYRYLEPKNSLYREVPLIGGRSVKNWPNLSTGISSLRPRLVLKNEFLIILNSGRRVCDWYVD